MIKPAFGVKNIIIFTLMLPFIAINTIFIISIIGSLFNGFEISVVPFAVIMIFMSSWFLVVVTNKAISQVVPKYFKCMKAVRKYITFNDLKELLKNEEFIPIEFPEYVKATFPKKRISLGWNLKYDLQLSEKWVCAQGVYIPKKIIIDIYNSLMIGGAPTIAFCTTIDEYVDKYEIGLFPAVYIDVMRYFKLGNEIPNLKKGEKTRENFIKKFKEEIQTREAFLSFLQND